MVDPLSVAASVAGFLGLAKTCIDLYEIISDAKHAAEDLEQLIALVRIERLRFLMWCEYVGIIEAMVVHGLSNDNGSRIGRSLIPELQRSFVMKELENILGRYRDTFLKSSAFLQSYVTNRERSFMSDLLSKATSDSTSTILVNTLWSDATSSRASLRQSMTVAQKLSWTVKDKRRFRYLVENLRLYNNSLSDILNMAERRQLSRRIELVATTTPIAKSINASQGKSGDQALFPVNDDIDRLIELFQRNVILESNDDKQNAGVQIVGQRKYDNNAHLETRTLLPSHLVYPSVEQQAHKTRFYTIYENRQVLVEWKYYSLRVSPQVLSALRLRVDMLTMQLQLSSKTSGFGVLNCIGHLEDKNSHRVGILFEYPKISDNISPLKPISLQERLTLDRKNKVIRDLEERFNLAKALVMSVFRLHSVGWLHKSIRSENVLFFEEAKQDLFSIAKPYLCGFDFSRQDSPGEMTENIPTVLLEHYIDVERSHYRHPELDHKPMVIYNEKEDNDNAQSEMEHVKDFKYQKKYDVYSLGMVLIEIGLWCPIKELAEQKLAQQKPALAVFRDKLMSRYLPELRYRMGERYHNVVLRCLSGNFNAFKKADETKLNDLELKDIRESRIWLENFEKEAVSELEKIAL